MILFNLDYYSTSEVTFKSVVYNTGLYEIVPGFIVGLIVCVTVSLFTKAPSKEVVELFDSVKEFKEDGE